MNSSLRTTHAVVRYGAACLLAACGLAAGALQQDHARNQRTSFHGAASMDAQRAAFERLGLPKEGVTPPKGVDPAIWAASLVPGLEPNEARVALGKALYFDTRLSADGTLACATCHDVTRGFTDQRPVAEGIGGQLGRRNSPTTLNAMLHRTQFWDGRARNVEHQAGMPILNPIEMGTQTEADVAQRIGAIPEYARAFQAAYGHPVTYEDIGNAIGAFERTLVLLDTPFDRFRAGDMAAISESAQRGWDLFNNKARCSSCHALNVIEQLGVNHKFHNIGVSARDKDFEGLAKRALAQLAQDSSEHALDRMALETDMSELGRFVVTQNYADIGAFKSQQLRNIGVTAPYMHDGSLTTLWDVMDHYNKGGEDNPYLDGGIEALALTEAEIDDVVAFLFTLTDRRLAEQGRAALDKQAAHARKNRPFRDDKLANRAVLGFERRVMGDQELGAKR